MGEARDNDAYEEELLDYEEEDEKAPDSVASKAAGESAKKWVSFSGFLTSVFLAKLQLCLVAGKVKENQSKKKKKKEKKEKEKGTACLAAGSLGLKCWKILESHSWASAFIFSFILVGVFFAC